VIKLSAGRRKEDRFQRVAKEAAKQCGRAVVPTVKAPCLLSDLAACFDGYDAVLLLWEEEQAQDLKQTLQELRQSQPVKKLLMLIGPEGGFTTDEANMVMDHGARR
jgi:16S rRNA (uracil1498-N3)-methyltransferase